MTAPPLAGDGRGGLAALVARWREQAAEWDRGYKEVLVECADELEAALSADGSEVAKLRREIEIRQRAVDRWVPCPDHRDKTNGGCYVCENERLQRALSAELARREVGANWQEVRAGETWRWAIYEVERGPDYFSAVGHEHVLEDFDTLDEAKAACEADARRLMQELSVLATPAPVGQGMVEAIAEYDRAVASVGGCSDGNCVILRPKGMHTNGGCRCFRDQVKAQRMMRAGQTLRNAIAAATPPGEEAK